MYYVYIFFIMKNNNTSSWALKELKRARIKINIIFIDLKVILKWEMTSMFT